jgi:hypothetical protein
MTWLAGALGVLLVVFIALYRRALRENRALGNYTLMLLLDEGVHAMQRKNLAELVRNIDARNTGDLFPKVKLSLDALAERLNINPLGVAAYLWKLRSGS